MGVDGVKSVKKIELQKLQCRRKLCLVLDLDHTLLHTNYLVTLTPQQKLHLSRYQGDDLYEWEMMGEKVFTKLRPFVRRFLKKASEMFELYVYTMGSRNYAMHVVEEFLDPKGVYFGNRVISREDCTVQGQKRLDVVPVHPRGVLILDDTWSVWKRNSSNLIVIEGYNYFSEVGGDESEFADDLRIALKVLKKLHNAYFKGYDHFKDGDVRELMRTHRMKDEGQQEVGSGVDDECSSITKKPRIC